jgi:hypothetical protein
VAKGKPSLSLPTITFHSHQTLSLIVSMLHNNDGIGGTSNRAHPPSSRAIISHNSSINNGNNTNSAIDNDIGSNGIGMHGATPKRSSNNINNRRLSTIGKTQPTIVSSPSPRGSPGNSARRLSMAASGQQSPVHSARGSGVHRMSVSVARSSHTFPTPAIPVNISQPPTASRVITTSPQPGARTLTNQQSSADHVAMSPAGGPSSHGHQLIAAVRAKQVCLPTPERMNQ